MGLNSVTSIPLPSLPCHRNPPAPPHTRYFPGGSDGKESACNAGDPGSIPGLGRSPGEGNGYPLQYSCLENSVDRGAWWATVHGVAKIGHDGTTNTHTLLRLSLHIPSRTLMRARTLSILRREQHPVGALKR